jgi:DNA-binding transcriptional ArsR family regulator
MNPMPITTSPREKIPHPSPSAFDLATIMRTVGEPVRLEIVRLLADDRARVCGDIAAELGLPVSTSSYHLKLLREAGVTRTQAQGTLRLVSLRRADLEARFPGLIAVLTDDGAPAAAPEPAAPAPPQRSKR